MRVSTRAVLVGGTLLGLAVRLYQLSRPGFLLGAPQYDDGVYFGSAVRLVSGYLPYRDFILVQPPGISVLLAPVALVAKATSTDTGLAIARVLTALVGALSVPLTGWLVRHRGPVWTLAVCLIVALHPDAVFSASTVFLEPWLVLLTLCGAACLFDGDFLAMGGRRVFAGGVCLGLAVAIKLWAIVPLAVFVLLYASRRMWGSLRAVAAGVCLSVLVCVAPFAVAAPGRFFSSVVSAQLGRPEISRVGLAIRLRSLLGPSHTHVGLAVLAIVGLTLACLAAATVLAPTGRRWSAATPLEWFAVFGAALIAATVLVPAAYFGHYAGYFAPFYALALVLAVGKLARAAVPRLTSEHRVALVLGGIVAVAGVVGVRELLHEARLHATGPEVLVGRLVPSGACVLSENPAFTLSVNRFEFAGSRCPPLVDPVGTDYALAAGRDGATGGGRYRQLRQFWMHAFADADFVWLSCADPGTRGCSRFTNRRIPWTPALLGYFHHHFALMPDPSAAVFKRYAPS